MITDKQIAALKYMIFNAEHGADLSKRVLAFLIDQSERLTKEVCLTLVADRERYTAEEIRNAGHEMGAMSSSNCTTHLAELLRVTGSELNFSYHYGDFDPTRAEDKFNCDGQFAGHMESQVVHPGLVRKGMPLRYKPLSLWQRVRNSRKSILLSLVFTNASSPPEYWRLAHTKSLALRLVRGFLFL